MTEIESRLDRIEQKLDDYVERSIRTEENVKSLKENVSIGFNEIKAKLKNGNNGYSTKQISAFFIGAGALASLFAVAIMQTLKLIGVVK